MAVKSLVDKWRLFDRHINGKVCDFSIKVIKRNYIIKFHNQNNSNITNLWDTFSTRFRSRIESNRRISFGYTHNCEFE